MIELHNTHKGKRCLLLACGPSINQYNNKQLNDLATNSGVVFCIKQTINSVDRCDFHFWNCSNMPVDGYKYKADSPPVVIASSNYSLGRKWDRDRHHDWFFRIPLDIQKSVSVVGNYDDYLFTKQMNRPCGPGIMLETVFYTAIHIGVTEIVTLGWDLTNTRSCDHFHNDKVVNPGSYVRQEIEDSIKSSEKVYYWLKSHGIQLKTLSKNSNIYKGIPRIS